MRETYSEGAYRDDVGPLFGVAAMISELASDEPICSEDWARAVSMALAPQSL